MPAETVFGGHGEPITDHVALIDSRFASTERRKEKIYRLIAERSRSGYELAQAIWGNVAVTQAFLTLSEVIGHTDILVNEGRVREVDDGRVIRFEAACRRRRGSTTAQQKTAIENWVSRRRRFARSAPSMNWMPTPFGLLSVTLAVSTETISSVSTGVTE